MCHMRPVQASLPVSAERATSATQTCCPKEAPAGWPSRLLQVSPPSSLLFLGLATSLQIFRVSLIFPSSSDCFLLGR